MRVCSDIEGYTPLHLAILHDHHIFARALLELGADVNAKGKLAFTPLHLALMSKLDYRASSFYNRFATVHSDQSHAPRMMFEGKTPQDYKLHVVPCAIGNMKVLFSHMRPTGSRPLPKRNMYMCYPLWYSREQRPDQAKVHTTTKMEWFLMLYSNFRLPRRRSRLCRKVFRCSWSCLTTILSTCVRLVQL